MYPLDRPQIFFLMTAPQNNLDIVVAEMVPNEGEMFDNFKRTFIREYIRARNEIVPDARIMREKWSNGAEGVVNSWSTSEIYNDFTKTNMWNAWMSGVPDF